MPSVRTRLQLSCVEREHRQRKKEGLLNERPTQAVPVFIIWPLFWKLYQLMGNNIYQSVSVHQKRVQRATADPTGPMIFLIVFTACFTAADAFCSCEPIRTVKEAFCKSDYVLMARVLSIDSRRSPYGANTVNTTNDGTWKYTIWHMQTWKGPMAATSALTTPYSEDNCGVHGLIKDVDYFLTGKKGKNGEVTFTSCDFVGPYSQLTTQEYYLLMELAWDSRQCKDIVGDKNVKEDGSIGSIVKESEERSVEEYDGESDEEEDSEEYDEDNGGETVEDNGEDPMEKKDEKPAHNSNSNTVD